MGRTNNETITMMTTTKQYTPNPSDLIGRSFLLKPREDGQRFRAHIVDCIETHEDQLTKQPEHIKFRCSIKDDQYKELLTYQEIMDYINEDEKNPVYWKFKRITAHEGPLDRNSPSYQGSKYNVMVEWEDGEVTSEPLSIMAVDATTTCAIYAKQNNLLHLEGWKQFRRIAKR